MVDQAILCPISGEIVKDLLCLGQQPIFMGVTADPARHDIYHEQTWGATASGIVQLKTRVPLNVLYGQSHNSGLIGDVWKLHHVEFASFIAKFGPRHVCEIGGGHGILFENFSKICDFDSWEVFDPHALSGSDPRLKVRRELFTSGSVAGQKDCAVHSHLFEHLYDHGSVLQALYRMLTSDGLMIFSVPNLREMVKAGFVNALNFEHVTYLSEDLIEYLLVRFGFEVIDKRYFRGDHSIFYACIKSEQKPFVEYFNSDNIDFIKNFFIDRLKDIQKLNQKLEDLGDGDDVFFFGAHIFSQFYLSNGISDRHFHSILDNDVSKQGKRLYGTNLSVQSPRILANLERPVVLLRVGAYRDEIAQQLRSINSAVRFID